MVLPQNLFPAEAIERAAKIKLVLTDCDGVLTDNGVYYGENGEAFKRFSIRDGTGVERLRKWADIETGVVSGENTEAMKRRAEKMNLVYVYLGVRYKPIVLNEILTLTGFLPEEIAYIGDDTNDVDVMKSVGLAACPSDATHFARAVAHYVCQERGGNGAFRELAELIISAKNSTV